MSETRELLLEIGAEEIPAGEVMMAVGSLEASIVRALDEARLAHGPSRTYATPRRLIVVVPDLAARQGDLEKEVSGPPTKVAFKDGQPTPAALGFAKGLGLTVDQLECRETPKGEYLFATVREAGQEAMSMLPGIISLAIGAIPFKRSMRWGTLDASFVRPIQWIVALFGGARIDVRYADVVAGHRSRGHRFMAPESFEVGSAAELIDGLAARHVVADVAARRAMIVEQAERLAAEAGGSLKRDEALVDQIVQLVENPVGMLGRFDEKYLEIPHQVLISEMREHQRYLSVVDADGRLLPRFVVIGNTVVRDPAIAMGGYQRVLSARFSDGAFFWHEDQKVSLADRAEKLREVQFHRALGSVHEKAERILALARWLADGVGSAVDRDKLARASKLMKADLVTQMVFEFPELQGSMGRAYALRAGEDPEVAAAIEEHYMPRNAQDDLPPGELGALLGLADRLDTIAGIFTTGKGPTGAADPYGLRRAAIAIINVLRARGWHLSLDAALAEAQRLLESKREKKDRQEITAEVLEFFRGRLKNMLTGDGLPTDVVEAALAAGFEDLADAASRAHALASLRRAPEFEPIAVAFKRVANILKGVDPGEVDAAALSEDAERALLSAADAVDAEVRAAVGRRDFEGALGSIRELRPTVDAFFEAVMVMAEDPAVRARRVALVGRVHRIFAPLADFTRLS